MNSMKLGKTFLLTVILLTRFYMPVMANATIETKVVKTFDDGSYIESSIVEEKSQFDLLSTTKTKSGYQTSTYKSDSGKTLWTITVHGTFTYNGKSAKCTASSVSTTCPSSNWKLSDKKSKKSGATAKASAVAKKYIDGTYIKTLHSTVTLTCSKSGKLS